MSDLLDNDLLSDRFKEVVKNIIEQDGDKELDIKISTDRRIREIENFIINWFKTPSDEDLSIID